MIFSHDPYKNDGASGAAVAGTAAAAALEAASNRNLHLLTLRHAVRDALRCPRPGTEEVVRAHFRAAAPAVRAQAGEWVRECEAAAAAGDGGAHTLLQRMRDAAAEVGSELDKLG